MRFISKLSFFAFLKGRVFLGFLAVLLTFPACQNPTSTEDAPSPPAERVIQRIEVTPSTSTRWVNFVLKKSDLTVKGYYDATNNNYDILQESEFEIGEYDSSTPTDTSTNSNGDSFTVTYLRNRALIAEFTITILPFTFNVSTSSGNTLNAVAYGNNKWIAAGKDNQSKSLFIEKGTTSWDSISDSSSDNCSITAAAYGQFDSSTGIFVYGYTYGDSPQNAGIAYSDGTLNGTTNMSTMQPRNYLWPAVSEVGVKGIAYGNRRFVAVGAEGNIARSNEISLTARPPRYPSNWEVATSVFQYYRAGDLNCVTYGNGKFVAGGVGGRIITSSDGWDWNEMFMTYGSDIKSIAFGDGKFVIISGNNPSLIAYSTDAQNWNLSRDIFTNQNIAGIRFNAVTYGKDRFVAVGRKQESSTWKLKIAYSIDGEHWYLATTGDSTANLTAIAYGDGKFVAVGANGTILYSTN